MFRSIAFAALTAATLLASVHSASAIIVLNGEMPNGHSTQGHSTQGYSTQGYATQGRSAQGVETQGSVSTGVNVIAIELPAKK